MNSDTIMTKRIYIWIIYLEIYKVNSGKMGFIQIWHDFHGICAWKYSDTPESNPRIISYDLKLNDLQRQMRVI